MAKKFATLGRWIVSPLAAAAVGWAAGAKDAPPPAGWTLTGILGWLLIAHNWVFIIPGVASGIATFLALRKWFDDKPPPPPTGTNELLETNNVLLTRIAAALERGPLTGPDVPIFREMAQAQLPTGTSDSAASAYAGEVALLAASDSATDRAAAIDVIGERPVEAGDRLMRESAERARAAARLYAPFAPSKAKAAYEAGSMQTPPTSGHGSNSAACA